MRKISAQNERCFRCGACFFKNMERRTPQQLRAEKAIRRSDGSDPLRKALSDEFGRERAVLLFLQACRNAASCAPSARGWSRKSGRKAESVRSGPGVLRLKISSGQDAICRPADLTGPQESALLSMPVAPCGSSVGRLLRKYAAPASRRSLASSAPEAFFTGMP